MKTIEQKLSDIGEELYRNFGPETYDIRCKLYDIVKELEASRDSRQLSAVPSDYFKTGYYSGKADAFKEIKEFANLRRTELKKEETERGIGA